MQIAAALHISTVNTSVCHKHINPKVKEKKKNVFSQ